MRISWGFKVTILYVGFVAMIITMAFLTTNSRTDLERVDYYEEELKHDQKMAAIKNMNELEETILAENLDGKLKITYPKEFNQQNAEVQIWVYKASNSSKDKRLNYVCSGKEQIIHTGDWDKGIYQLRFNTKTNNKEFFFEKEIKVK
jgi:hypothetical protein